MKKKRFSKLLLASGLLFGATTPLLVAASCSKTKKTYSDNSALMSVAKKLHKFYKKDWKPTSGSKTFDNFVGPANYTVFANYVTQLINTNSNLYTFNQNLQTYLEQNDYALALTNWDTNNYKVLTNLVSHSIIYFMGTILVSYMSYRYERSDTKEDTSTNKEVTSPSSYWGQYMKFFLDQNLLTSSFVGVQNAILHENIVDKKGVFMDRYFKSNWSFNLKNNLNNPNLININPLPYDHNMPNSQMIDQPFNGLYFAPSGAFTFGINFGTHYDVSTQDYSLTHYSYKLEPNSFVPNTNKVDFTTQQNTNLKTIFDAYKTYVSKSPAPSDKGFNAFFQQLNQTNKNLYYSVFQGVSSSVNLTSILNTALSTQFGTWTSQQVTKAISALNGFFTNLAFLKFSTLLVYKYNGQFSQLSGGVSGADLLKNVQKTFVTNRLILSNGGFDTTLKNNYENFLNSPRFLVYKKIPNLYKFFASEFDLSNVTFSFGLKKAYPTNNNPTNGTIKFNGLGLNFQFVLSGGSLSVENIDNVNF